MNEILSDSGLDLLFREARTHSHWRGGDIGDALLREVYDLAKMPPTSANSSPMRLVFLRSREAKERLGPALMAGNLTKTMAAPVTAIIGYDTRFFELLPRLYPHENARAWFEGDPALIEETASRNGTLQGAYFILAARSLARPRLRAHVGLRPKQGRPRVFSRRPRQVELSVQSGLW
jgi:3-hydroxypropanoate dehydrogenase